MSGHNKQEHQARVSLWKIALLHRCVACGKGGMYDGVLTIRERCKVCDFPLKKHDAGDGPAFFAMSITGTVVTVLAVLMELHFQIAIWLHVVLWLPLTLILSIGCLRIGKSWLIGMQYRHNVDHFQQSD